MCHSTLVAAWLSLGSLYSSRPGARVVWQVLAVLQGFPFHADSSLGES